MVQVTRVHFLGAYALAVSPRAQLAVVHGDARLKAKEFAMSKSNLAVLTCLRTVTLALQESSKPLSATRLLRTYKFDDTVFWEAVEYGYEKKFIEWGDRNVFSLLNKFEIPEEAYYAPIKDSLCDLWLSEAYDKSQFYLEDTSRKGTKIAGPWTRPDFTMVSHRKYPWTIGHEFDVITFEVKRSDTCNVLAVFEALSHASVATRSYVVFPMSEASWIAADPAQAKRVKDECVRHGIGLVLISDIADTAKPVHFIRAQRKEIDHERCSNFLSAVMTEDGKRKIAEWK